MSRTPDKTTLEQLAKAGVTPERYSREISEYSLERGCSRQMAWKAIREKYLGEKRDSKSVSCVVTKSSKKAASLPVPPSVNASDFGGRTATMAEIVEFVAGHALVDGVTPGMCPDPRAYTYWWHCKNDPDFCKDFLKATAVKLMPSKVAPEDGRGAGDYDGKVQADTIDAILALKGSSEEIAG